MSLQGSGLSRRLARLPGRMLVALLSAALVVSGLVVGAPAAAAEPGCLHSSDDFDGDGTPDPVIGAPGESGGRDPYDGSVEVRISNEGKPFITRIDGDPGFGSAVATLSAYHGQGDEELCSELAVAAPSEDSGEVAQVGAVYIYSWDRTEKRFQQRVRLTPGENGVPGKPTHNLGFGTSLAAEPRAGDQSDPEPSRLYVGAPGASVDGHADAGAVIGFTVGSGDQPQAENAETISYADEDLDATPADRAGFGQAISVNQGILAVGAPWQPVNTEQRAGGVDDAGEVAVLSTTKAFEPYTLHQGDAGVPGRPEPGDLFGAALHVTPPVDGEQPRLMIGIPGEGFGDLDEAGSVDVVPLSATTGRPDGPIVGWDQDSPKMAGVAEEGDDFGRSVSSVLVDGTLQLVVGTPAEAVGKKSFAGMVQTIGTGRGWTQDTVTVPATAEFGDEMGATLSASADGSRLLIGVPGENDNFGAALTGIVEGDVKADIWGPTRDEPVAYGTAMSY